MGHAIEQPWDRLFSTHSTEWHGLAEHVETIDTETVKPLLFPIIESPTYTEIEGEKILLPDMKTLIADLSFRTDLDGVANKIALHTPKKTYTTIDNGKLWDSIQQVIKEYGFKVITAGTIEKCKKFFVTLDIGSSEMVVNKDKFLFHLVFVTSHDGSMAVTVYDSNIRVVCCNTLIASMNAQGDVGFKAYHTKNANIAMERLPELINEIFSGRAAFKNQMEYFASVPVTREEVGYITAAYFANNSANGFLSTRGFNIMEEVQHLFENGMGNHGVSLYDLANAFTESYTHGSGTGATNGKTTKAQRAYKANFGTASIHKKDFVNFITGDVHKFKEIGKRALMEYSKINS